MKEVISKKEMGVSRYSSIILGLLFLVIQGCAGVGPDLEKAKEQNTEQAYPVSYTHLTLPTKRIV